METAARNAAGAGLIKRFRGKLKWEGNLGAMRVDA